MKKIIPFWLAGAAIGWLFGEFLFGLLFGNLMTIKLILSPIAMAIMLYIGYYYLSSNDEVQR